MPDGSRIATQKGTGRLVCPLFALLKRGEACPRYRPSNRANENNDVWLSTRTELDVLNVTARLQTATTPKGKTELRCWY